MKAVVSALLALSLLLVMGCENDENTVDPILKPFSVYPVFDLKIDNGYQTFGIDSVELTTVPGVGWPGPVYSDQNGFLGTMAEGTFIDRIDTIPDADSVIIDTLWKVYDFSPLTTYQFNFSRSEPFIWLDSFRADYAFSVESLWVLFAAETLEVTVAPDPERPPETVLYRVEQLSDDDYDPLPDDTVVQELLYGFWEDTAFVIPNADDTVDFPPDSIYFDTVTWVFWHRIDTFFLPPEPEIWCSLDSMVIVEDTFLDINGYPNISTDTLYYYGNCDPRIDSIKQKIYRDYGWGVYPGGDQDETPIPSFDTTIHFIFPDTAKRLVFDNGALSVEVPDVITVIDSVTSDTTWKTVDVTIEFIHDGGSQQLDNMNVELTMPDVEVYPEYEYIIREVNSGKK